MTRRRSARWLVRATFLLPALPGTRLLALQRAHDPHLRMQKLRFLCAANDDRTGGRKSTGVRGWLVYCVYGLDVSPVPNPLDVSAGHRREVEV